MKSRRMELDREAKRLMGMGGIQVYECKTGYHAKDHYYGVVWRGKQRWAVPVPWDANKHVLYEVGLSLRYRANMDEQFEKIIQQSEVDAEEQRRDNASDKDQMVKECKRTLIDKPLYFYNQ